MSNDAKAEQPATARTNASVSTLNFAHRVARIAIASFQRGGGSAFSVTVAPGEQTQSLATARLASFPDYFPAPSAFSRAPFEAGSIRAALRKVVRSRGVDQPPSMAKYLISFPSEAMVVTAEELPIVGADARAVIAEAKAAGVYVFAGGINESVEPVLVAADGAVSAGTHPGSVLKGGFTVLELPDRAAAEHWAAKIARACRCAQELREFGYDPES